MFPCHGARGEGAKGDSGISLLPSPFPFHAIHAESMYRAASIILLLACAGCQWARLRDPVPASLAASRKLSSEGNELLEQKQPEKAEERLAQAVKVCPTDCDARRYYAETLWLRKRADRGGGAA